MPEHDDDLVALLVAHRFGAVYLDLLELLAQPAARRVAAAHFTGTDAVGAAAYRAIAAVRQLQAVVADVVDDHSDSHDRPRPRKRRPAAAAGVVGRREVSTLISLKGASDAYLEELAEARPDILRLSAALPECSWLDECIREALDAAEGAIASPRNLQKVLAGLIAQGGEGRS